jgi:hypothetical protein
VTCAFHRQSRKGGNGRLIKFGITSLSFRSVPMFKMGAWNVAGGHDCVLKHGG